MGSFKDFDKKAPAPGQMAAERKNDEETGQPVQLPDDKQQQQPRQKGKQGDASQRNAG